MEKSCGFRHGEIPKRLKGLPWKGSRSLIAARGFKSLFLRFENLRESMRKAEMRAFQFDDAREPSNVFEGKKDFEKN